MTSQVYSSGVRGPQVSLELWGKGPSASGLARAEMVEIRRANRQVRSFLAGRAGRSRGAEARDAMGRPVDPAHPDARSFSIVGAFLAATRPSPWLFRRWMALAHEAAAEILGDPVTDIFAYNDAPEIGQDAIHALLEEIDARITPFVDVNRPAPSGRGR